MARTGLVRALPWAAVVAIICLLLVGCGAGATDVPMPSSRAATEASFSAEDGLELKGRLFGDGATGVVLAHMFPADQSSWWDFAGTLAERGYTALAFDFRGYGESGGDKDIELIDRDVRAAVAFLEAQGVSSIFLAGASMGGTASLKVGAAESDRVLGVVSLSAPVEFKGLSVKREQVRVPVLLMVTRGDVSARDSLDSMLKDGIVGPQAETVVYEEGGDHGTDILTGSNSPAARDRILSFLESRAP